LSSKYEGSLADFSTTFAKRREEIKLALMIHTTHGVDTANQSLIRVEEHLQGLDEKLKMLLVFNTLDSPREQRLKDYLKEHGSENCKNDDNSLQEMISIYEKADPEAGDNRVIPSLTVLKAELAEEWEVSLRKNMEEFKNALKSQEAQLAKVFREINDAGIATLLGYFESGPHNQIHDLVR